MDDGTRHALTRALNEAVHTFSTQLVARLRAEEHRAQERNDPTNATLFRAGFEAATIAAAHRRDGTYRIDAATMNDTEKGLSKVLRAAWLLSSRTRWDDPDWTDSRAFELQEGFRAIVSAMLRAEGPPKTDVIAVLTAEDLERLTMPASPVEDLKQ